jgi:2-hydroxychromene-2-carboxylate isomerase
VLFFFDPADPYSHLAAPLLAKLAERYQVRTSAFTVSAPDAGAAPDAERLAAWSERDAASLARAYGMTPSQVPPVLCDKDPAVGDALRRRLGHYLGATFYFEGEWYWGIDRLHYLEARLRAAGLDRTPAAADLAPVRQMGLLSPPPVGPKRVLNMFLSFRSPYTYIAMARAGRLAAHYGAELRLRFVLPMVMRGLPVPSAKRLYIARDTKREAERLGLRFGNVVDPVGPGVERGLAVLHQAIALGRGAEFAESFLQGVFADGLDAASDPGLFRIAARAGLDEDIVAVAVRDDTWRAVAEANRAELLAAGLWGVPCFRVDDGPVFWGQDRLWAVERHFWPEVALDSQDKQMASQVP